ncbi:unnamed protein product, partial [Ectocarpus fasciculatus]
CRSRNPFTTRRFKFATGSNFFSGHNLPVVLRLNVKTDGSLDPKSDTCKVADISRNGGDNKLFKVQVAFIRFLFRHMGYSRGRQKNPVPRVSQFPWYIFRRTRHTYPATNAPGPPPTKYTETVLSFQRNNIAREPKMLYHLVAVQRRAGNKKQLAHVQQ